MISLGHLVPPIRNQDGLNSCMAIVICDALSIEFKRRVRDGTSHGELNPSPLFLYYTSRKRFGHENHNVPVPPSETMAALEEFGVCPEELWAYGHERWRNRPSTEAFRRACALREVSFEPLSQSLDDLVCSLEDGRPFWFCLRLYESNFKQFDDGRFKDGDLLAMPKQEEAAIRNHAMLVTGYDETSRSFEIRNSFGPNWGMAGTLRVPAKYLENRSSAYAFGRIQSFRVEREYWLGGDA